ncbi:phenylacetate-coenzyme A ligase PaaK [Thermacetogenium phaeum DSM 12270]|uniref:Phenylacetate-coenzyme A ligase n=1 Tax=Thermacetogenium phaeum (strain ATCC BAA-254 / DSM 26808 / PB) TaxID=1089553 RepID=K4LHC3_THEPS|nr:phenylacetate--CoA ligase [Thermacetogenium phaeum]AFV11472.1 phenylacetate-coenzyme A ligase PaaK [Thermacetogenium phaeum DSM 12270]
MTYWNERYECMPRSELHALQEERLRATVSRVYHEVPFYRHAFQKLGLMPGDIQTLGDLVKLPFTTKNDLRDNYPYGLFAVPMSEVVRLHASSGTTGKPTVVGYTRHDLDVWAEVMARSLTCCGAGKHSKIQNAYGYGLFTGGLGVHYGAERIGASVIPVSGGHTKRQIMIMKDFGSTILTCTPSYALYLAEVMEEMGVSKDDLSLEGGLFGAEPWSENLRKQIEGRLGILALDVYGLSEIIGPGVAVECPVKEGLHVWEDHFLVEIVDPETGEQLPPGKYGELVITTLTKEALPLLRYRTRDITRIIQEPCSCGRTHIKIDRFQGRTDDMLVIRGVNVFPSQIEEVLFRISHTEPFYQIIVDRKGQLDELEVWVEISEDVFSDEIRKLEKLEEEIRREIEAVLGISVKVKLVEPKTIERSEGKATRVIDRRQL